MRRARFIGIMIAGLTLGGVVAEAQSVRSLVEEGNDQYEEENFDGAEVHYRKALEQERDLVQGHFNLGDALHKQGKYEDAVREFERVALDAHQQEARAFAYYNMGNSHFEAQQYKEAIASYIESLKLNPADQDAKYNLSLALKRLEQQQQQQQQQGGGENKEKDQREKDQEQQEQQNQERDRQAENRNDEQKDQERKPASQEPKKMSKADAERILDVLKNSEKEIQKKLRARQAVRPKGEKDW